MRCICVDFETMSQFLSTPSRRLYPCSDPRTEWMQFPLTLSLVRTPQKFLLQLCLVLLLLFRMHRVHVEHHRAQHVLPCCIFEPLLRINYEWSTLRWVVMVSIHLFDSFILVRRCFLALILPSLISVRLQNCYELRSLRYCQKKLLRHLRMSVFVDLGTFFYVGQYYKKNYYYTYRTLRLSL